MSTSPLTLLCLYRYDPLDRLTSHTQSTTPEQHRFYCKSRLATEIQGSTSHSIIQHGDQLLAQQQREDDALDTTLLATDQQRSVLHTLKANNQRHPIAYSPYGHRPAENGLLSLLGFNGKRPDPVTRHYLLGNGYRAFNPVLMRFNSPDSLSPFQEGGLNTYAYCLNDPINASDSSGQAPIFQSILKSLHGTYDKSRRKLLTRIGYRTSPVIPRRLSDPGPMTPPLIDPDFMGYHGTSTQSVQKLLQEGVRPATKGVPGRHGFYFSPDKETTFEYARSKQSLLERTKTNKPSRSTNTSFGEDNIVEVHAQNLTGMTPGRDYDFNHYPTQYLPNRMSMEFFIKPHKSRAVVIREFGSTSPTQKVRPRAHEAPF
jgi:RHS repeat-associated protein